MLRNYRPKADLEADLDYNMGFLPPAFAREKRRADAARATFCLNIQL
jgi:hypothetical protein